MSTTPLQSHAAPLPSTKEAVIDAFDALDIIGNGSFGIIRKVRRKADGMIFARKELNFERMSERDRKQIVAEVNILRDLNHENIVRYHDRYVDVENGMLYLVMEYCGGGDLGSLIKSARKHKRIIPEDTIWHFFYQITLALHFCHTPHLKPGYPGEVLPDAAKRAPILHRDLKPENVFLDEQNHVKLGDFGLSKQLSNAAFTNTYVGTPYYMSPELIQERDYDAKSDIWSLGCLIYELCALNPPFHEAKTHSELANFIRAGSIPSLPPHYSNALTNAVKAMLNLNPAKRPSAAQLLGHERMHLAVKTAETQKILNTLSSLRATLHQRQDALNRREQELAQREQDLEGRMENEISTRIAAREEEIMRIVVERENTLRQELLSKEEAMMQAVLGREAELKQLWEHRESELRAEVAKRDEEIMKREAQLRREAERLDTLRREMEARRAELAMSAGSSHSATSGKSTKSGKSTHSRKSTTSNDDTADEATPIRSSGLSSQQQRLSRVAPPIFETPVMKRSLEADPGSAMRGVILGNGQAVPTPHASHLNTIIADSPATRVDLVSALNFVPPPVPSFTAGPSATKKLSSSDKENESPAGQKDTPASLIPQHESTKRLRRPSSAARLRSDSGVTPTGPLPSGSNWLRERPALQSVQSMPSSVPSAPSPIMRTASVDLDNDTIRISREAPAPTYDPDDDVNLPSPFLKRVERPVSMISTTSGGSNSEAGGSLGRGAGTKLLQRVKSTQMLKNLTQGATLTGTLKSVAAKSVGSTKSIHRRASSAKLGEAPPPLPTSNSATGVGGIKKAIFKP